MGILTAQCMSVAGSSAARCCCARMGTAIIVRKATAAESSLALARSIDCPPCRAGWPIPWLQVCYVSVYLRRCGNRFHLFADSHSQHFSLVCFHHFKPVKSVASANPQTDESGSHNDVGTRKHSRLGATG